MSNQKNKSLIPKLRFLEFRGSDEWEATTIGNIGSFYYGKSAPKWSLEQDAPTPCVRYGELYTKFGAIITETYSRTNIDPNNLKFSKGGEILVPRVGEKAEDFGKCCCYLTLKNIAIGEMISVFETTQNPLFYTYYFRNLYRQFAKVVEGQNVKNLYYVELEPLQIYRPKPPEQQKIADCLTSLDDLITAESDKLEAYKAHKKGLLQKLFPVEGKTVPEWRFPEFRDAEEWNKKSLNEITTHVDYRGKSPVKQDSGIFLVTAKNIKQGYIDYTASCEYVSLEDYDEVMKRGKPNVGDILFTTEAPMGNVAQVDNENIALAQRVIKFRCKPIATNEYLKYFMLTDVFQQTLSLKGIGSTVQGIQAKVLHRLPILIPTLLEQQKIADCLSSLDNLIIDQAQKIETLKMHKKGLMQGLFPSAEEVGA